jgi:hypothetical protein
LTITGLGHGDRVRPESGEFTSSTQHDCAKTVRFWAIGSCSLGHHIARPKPSDSPHKCTFDVDLENNLAPQLRVGGRGTADVHQRSSLLATRPGRGQTSATPRPRQPDIDIVVFATVVWKTACWPFSIAVTVMWAPEVRSTLLP